MSSHDRVYAANQTSNTVSVIDPSNNKLLGVIRLGDPVPGALSPLYQGQLLVHGLGYSPDGKTLAVISIASNSVALIETATNKVRRIIYVGRSPHEAFYTPDGRELWVSVRGEDYISVIDPMQMTEIRQENAILSGAFVNLSWVREVRTLIVVSRLRSRTVKSDKRIRTES